MATQRSHSEDIEPVDRWSTLHTDLAAAYRLVALFAGRSAGRASVGATAGAGASFPDQPARPVEEITASSLVKIDLDGNIVGSSPHRVPAGFTIHSAVHAARADARCVIHVHTNRRHRRVQSGAGPAADQPDRDADKGRLRCRDLRGIALNHASRGHD